MTAYLGGSCSFVCHFCAYSSFLFGFGGWDVGFECLNN